VLTKTKVDSIPYSASGQTFYLDSELVGFGLRVGKSTKAYYAERRVNGKTVRVTIGKHGHITAEQARREAQRLLAIMKAGRNPHDEKKQGSAKGGTLKEVFAHFLNNRTSLQPRTVYDYKRVVNACFGDWQKKPLKDIKQDMIKKRHEQIGKEHGKAYANLAMRILRAIFNFAIAEYDDNQEQPVMSENPVVQLSQTRAWYRVKQRTTALKAHELPAFFEGLNQLHDRARTTKAHVVKDYLLLLLFTGLHRQEAAQLRWYQVDFNARMLIVTNNKNDDPLTLPLSDYLYDLLQARFASKVNDCVFPGNSENGYIVEPRQQIRKVVRHMKAATGNPCFNFTIHDLRRTFINVAHSLDISSYAVERLVHHKMSGDVTTGDPEWVRKPMQQITDYLLLMARAKPKNKAVDLKTRRGGRN